MTAVRRNRWRRRGGRFVTVCHAHACVRPSIVLASRPSVFRRVRNERRLIFIYFFFSVILYFYNFLLYLPSPYGFALFARRHNGSLTIRFVILYQRKLSNHIGRGSTERVACHQDYSVDEIDFDFDGDGPSHHGSCGLPGFPGVRGLFRWWWRQRQCHLVVVGPARGRRRIGQRRETQPASTTNRWITVPADDCIRAVHKPSVHEDIRQQEGCAQGTAQATVPGRLGHTPLFQVQVCPSDWLVSGLLNICVGNRVREDKIKTCALLRFS